MALVLTVQQKRQIKMVMLTILLIQYHNSILAAAAAAEALRCQLGAVVTEAAAAWLQRQRDAIAAPSSWFGPPNA